jgi:tetratricopeptide (TPR) repeat protein
MNMQNKKSIIIIAFFIVCFGLVYIFVLNKKINNSKDDKVEIVKDEQAINLPKLECNFETDQKVFEEALKTNTIDSCSCLKEAEKRNSCIVSVSDNVLYNRALGYLDEDLCNEINSKQSKEACFMVVRDSIEQLKEKDPQRLAYIYAMSHNEKAIANYEKIIENGSIDIADYLALALSYAEKGLKEQEQGRSQDDYVNKAFGVVEKAKSIDNKNSEVYRVEAYVNEIKPDYNKAKELYNEAISINPENILAYTGRGHLNRMRGAFDVAINDFKFAAGLDKEQKNTAIYTNLCNLEFSRSNFEESIKNCKIVVNNKAADPVFRSEAYQIMAMALMQNKDLAQARNYLLNAKTLTPNDANLYVMISKLNIYEGRYIDAEENAKKANELSPFRASGYLALSQALYMQKKFDDSIAIAEKGLSLVAKDVSLLGPTKPAVIKDLYYSIANNYRQKGDTLKEKEYINKAQEAIK